MYLTFLATSLDVKLLLFSVFLRKASFGLTNQVLTLFLESVGVSKPKIGTFMTLTLVGDTAISFLLTWFSDHLGRRLVMVAGCVLMLASGLVFAKFENFWVLLSAAIFGVISTSGDETGPFKTVEEACLSQLTSPMQRAHVFAIYGLLGTFGSAVGSSACGFLIEYWILSAGWTLQACYRAVFIGYAGVALAKLALALCLSNNCEISQLPIKILAQHLTSDSNFDLMDGALITEESSLLGTEVSQDVEEALGPKTITPKYGISAQSRKHLARLLVVFMLDSFGYGFMPPAWIVYYFRTVFKASPSALGNLFFFTNMVDSLSSLVSAFTFSIFGPVKAILVAQLPSAVFFTSIPFCSSYLLAAAFYFLFCACATMDVVPRQILLTTIIPKEDLIKVLGVVNIAKTFARCVGPIFTGNLAEKGLLYVAFIVNGACLFLADTILGVSFVHLDGEILSLHKQQ
ncbi:MFS general substrate transporter [Metschnikowia bicuspidata var. bicuspidata NRRL YB-4993]|uniref:MFS general substrate transporter n=1 Tax=Metschnikowia bicuspidata var. bicuspidata NRRL YB-4993 TaxID=869754 RepID=A0A1A0H6I5_9ASCO|nr:MFS general substrate transporter [Metschnikowia bicuspidata var. bicuspidata NRRL YB-4993]OBA19523.1 MFS general substrate transporter [Metschnikowia bicuspidata var. bicuspidata NRRL YB-4993]